MDNIDSDTNEQEFFAKLLSDSKLDDSACEEYQAKLRSQMLNVFDSSDISNETSDSVVPQSVTTIHRINRQTLLAIASIAACLVCVATFWSAGLSVFNRFAAAKPQPVSSENPVSSGKIDPLLLATVAEVDAWQDTVPADAFFDALAQCELQLETRMQANTTDEMRRLYESSLFTPDTPKG